MKFIVTSRRVLIDSTSRILFIELNYLRSYDFLHLRSRLEVMGMGHAVSDLSI